LTDTATLLSQQHSARILENGKHWRSELAAAANAGKLVVVYLAKPELRYRYTGERQFSGTGRSRVTTNIVTEISSYHAVPNVSSVEAKTGSEVKLTTTATLLIPYWKEFGELAPYEAFVDGEFTERLTNAHERGQPFTDKCLTAAKRLGVALVRTTDLFEPARYLRDHPDAEYAMQCREAIFAASGEVCRGFL
jgi:hypothetical protein